MGKLRIGKRLNSRRTAAEVKRRGIRKARRANERSEAFLRDRGFYIPDQPGQIILGDR